MTNCNVKLADEVFTVCCRCPETALRLRAFTTEESGGVTVSSDPAREKSLREQLRTTKRGQNRDCDALPDDYIEFLSLHEQLAHALTAKSVLLLHGTAIVANGAAVLLLAPTCVGKSTHARLWLEAFGDAVFCLNDDKPLLRVSERATTVYASPWGRMQPASAERSAPLKAIIRLERGENRICRATEQALFPDVYAASLRGETPAEALRNLQLQKQLLAHAERYQMSCDPTPAAAHMAYRAVFGE